MAFGLCHMTPDLFWSLTVYEFCRYLEGNRLKAEYDLANAWWTAHLTTIGHHNPRKFPKFSSLTGKSRSLSEEERSKTKAFLESKPRIRKRKETQDV